MFKDVDKSYCTLKVTERYVNKYITSDQWKDFKHIVGIVYDYNSDTNGDGEVNASDINLIINIILGNTDSVTTADVNGDGSIDASDINSIINLILAK